MKSRVLFCGEECINKNAFHKKIKPINIDNLEMKRITLFNKTSYSSNNLFKYYIGDMHEVEGLSPLCIKLPQLIGYTKYFNNDNRYVKFLINDKKLLKNTMKYGIKLKAYLKKNLIKNHCLIVNILMLK